MQSETLVTVQSKLQLDCRYVLVSPACPEELAAKCRCLPEAEHAAAEVLMSKLGTLTSWSAAPWE